MTDPEQAAARGKRAQQLLADELLKESFATLKAEYRNAWENSGPRDTDGRERLWQAFQIIGKVETHLTTVMSDGKIAQHELSRLTRGT